MDYSYKDYQYKVIQPDGPVVSFSEFPSPEVRGGLVEMSPWLESELRKPGNAEKFKAAIDRLRDDIEAQIFSLRDR